MGETKKQPNVTSRILELFDEQTAAPITDNFLDVFAMAEVASGSPLAAVDEFVGTRPAPAVDVVKIMREMAGWRSSESTTDYRRLEAWPAMMR